MSRASLEIGCFDSARVSVVQIGMWHWFSPFIRRVQASGGSSRLNAPLLPKTEKSEVRRRAHGDIFHEQNHWICASLGAVRFQNLFCNINVDRNQNSTRARRKFCAVSLSKMLRSGCDGHTPERGNRDPAKGSPERREAMVCSKVGG